MKSLHLYVITSVFLIFSACNKDNGEDSPAISTVNEKSWTLKYIQGISSNYITYFPDIPEKISIEFNNKRLIFNGICNTGGANVALENDKISISDFVTTEIYCANIDWELLAENGLRGAYKFELSDNKLFIFSTEYNLVFE